jgi:putative spermidine/putrescine transport system substrate-binding protein
MLMNRRSFLAGAGGAALATLLAGCQRGTAANLRLAMLANSVPAQLLRAFQKDDQGGSVAVTPQDSLVGLYSLLQGWHNPPTGASVAPVADWVSLADYWLAPAIQQGLVKPPDVSSLAGWDTLAPVWPELVRRGAQGMPSTEGDIWAMPYRWSHLVLLYDPTRLPPDQALSTWADLLRPELTRRVILPDHPRLVIGLAQKALGASANSADPDAVDGLQSFLSDLHQQVRTYDTNHYLEALIIGDATAVVGWSDDVLPLLKQYQQLAAVVPPEGTLLSAQLWVQSEVISAQSPLALNWLDFCLGDDFAQQLAIYGQSASPNLWGVGPNDLPQPLQQPSTQVLLPEVADQSEFLLPLTPEAEARYSSLWQNLRQPA